MPAIDSTGSIRGVFRLSLHIYSLLNKKPFSFNWRQPKIKHTIATIAKMTAQIIFSIANISTDSY